MIVRAEGTYGRKLQAELGRWETRVKISEIRRCWTLVSCDCLAGVLLGLCNVEPDVQVGCRI